MKTLEKIDNRLLTVAFASEFGQQHGMPELHTQLPFTTDDLHTGRGNPYIESSWHVTPDRQLASFVKRMTVTVRVYAEPELTGHLRDYNGAVRALVKIRYDHHSGGSNGIDRSFLLTVRKDADDEPVVLNGWTDYETAMRFQNMAVRAYQNRMEGVKA